MSKDLTIPLYIQLQKLPEREPLLEEDLSPSSERERERESPFWCCSSHAGRLEGLGDGEETIRARQHRMGGATGTRWMDRSGFL